MMNVLINLGFSILTFIIFTFVRLSVGNEFSTAFFTVCGIFFSVGMSQIISFDFSKIINSEIYKRNMNGLKKVRMSFIFQFALASIAFIILKLIEEKDLILPFLISKSISFHINVFLNFIIIYSLLFFVYNFHILANKKNELDNIINKEKQEELEERDT